VTILGDGTQVRDYLFIDDAVRGLEFIATAGAAGEEYNLASGVPVTLLELTKKIAIAMECPDIVIKTTGRSFAGDTARWYADISKIRTLGFEPEIDLDTGLRQTIAWLKTIPVVATT
jgi:nucleoside-diphosphate-sugar epimerase